MYISAKSYVPSSGRMYLSAISSIRSLRERANVRASRSASAPVVASSRWQASSGNFASTGTRRSPRLRAASTRSPERKEYCIWYGVAGGGRERGGGRGGGERVEGGGCPGRRPGPTGAAPRGAWAPPFRAPA